MIVRDEERLISGVLADAASFCDELVVLDTGSTDRTVELAVAAGAHVTHFPWVDDFAAARNASFAACTGDWVLWLDADDRLPEAVQLAFQELKRTGLHEDFDVLSLPYRYHWTASGESCTFAFPRERVVRRSAGLRWEHRVHEVIAVPDGRIRSRTDLWVEHRPLPEDREHKSERNLRILRSAVADGDRSPRTLFYLGNELRDHGAVADAAAAYQGFLQIAPAGWERYNALVDLSRCLKGTGDPDGGVQVTYQAVQEDPTRAEAFVELGRYHYERQEWLHAVPFLIAATSLPPPTSGFVSLPDYTYVAWDMLSICYHQLGRQADALNALGRCVDGNPDRPRLEENAKWFVRTW